MTGYGRYVVQLPNKKITVELKSVNSKTLDINARIPSLYREKELELRNFIATGLERGKIDMNLFIEITGEETSTQINPLIIRHYMSELRNIVAGDEMELLKMAIRMPEALKVDREAIDEREYHSIQQALHEAIELVKNYRLTEGKALEIDIAKRAEAIGALLRKVDVMETDRLPKVRERLRKTLSELEKEIDENRFEQELLYYIEKYDITEEKVRLANHLEYFKTSLASEDSNGKKLGFICQEIGREINTIGSKAYDAPLQKLSVEMKDELEKIKEQLLNVL
jgi:uncharacterized protein (TIGR00255 family)